MDDQQRPSELESLAERPVTLKTWSRVYLHGILVFVVIYALFYLIKLVEPFFDFVGNRPLAIGLATLTILCLPPLLGGLMMFIVYPLIGRKPELHDFVGWDDRLFSEVVRARKKARIVLINWPSKDVRSFGVLTSTFEGDASGKQLAAVYVPTAPMTRLGYIRIVPVEDLEFTDWSLKQWQVYQFTFGAMSPDSLGSSSSD